MDKLKKFLSIPEIISLSLAVGLSIIILWLNQWNFSELLATTSNFVFLLLGIIVASLGWGFGPKINKLHSKYGQTHFNEEKHQTQLENLFKKMLEIYIAVNPDHTFALKVPKNVNSKENYYVEVPINDSNAYFENSEEYLGYYDRFESHIKCKEYENIFWSWDLIKMSLNKYNRLIPDINRSLEEFVINKCNFHFKELMASEKNGMTKNYFHINNICEMLFELLSTYAELDEKLDFVLRGITDKKTGRWKIVRGKKRFGDKQLSLIELPKEDKSVIDRLKQLIDSCYDYSKLYTQFSDLVQEELAILQFLDDFRPEMERIVSGIDEGVLIKGTCETCT